MLPHLRHFLRFVLADRPQDAHLQFIQKTSETGCGDFTFWFTLGNIPDPNSVFVFLDHKLPIRGRAYINSAHRMRVGMGTSGEMVRFRVHVKTLSPETRLVDEPDHTLTLFVAAAPVKGKANREIVKWLAKKLGKSSSQVRIVAGLYSNSKVIEVSGIGKEEAAQRLEVHPNRFE
jgi:hypothetical protein